MDHVIPLTYGGDPFDPDNLRAACRSCNARGGAQITNYRKRRYRTQYDPDHDCDIAPTAPTLGVAQHTLSESASASQTVRPAILGSSDAVHVDAVSPDQSWGAAGSVPSGLGAGGDWAPPRLVVGADSDWAQTFDCGDLRRSGVDLLCPDDDVFRRPLFATPADPTAEHRLDDYDSLAKAFGLDLLPWQRYVLRVASELDADGLPRYRTVIISVGRQCGKSIIGMLLAADQLIGSGRLRTAIWIAGTQTAGLTLWRDDFAPLWEASGVECAGSWGANAPRLRTSGGTLRLYGGSKRAAVGSTADILIIDESFSVESPVADAALPVIRARPAAQAILMSAYQSAPSKWWLDNTATGRRAAVAAELGNDSGSVAHFEWGPTPGLSLNDSESWTSALPVLDDRRNVGPTTRIVRSEASGQQASTFHHAGLNLRPAGSGGEPVLPARSWSACVVDPARTRPPSGCVWIAVDVNPQTSAVDGAEQHGSIVGIDDSGLAWMIDYRKGTGWIDDGLTRVIDTWRPETVISLLGGPASATITQMEANGRLDAATEHWGSGQMIDASSTLLDAVVSGDITVVDHPALVVAGYSAIAKPLTRAGGGWSLWRPDWTCSVSPLLALAMVVHARKLDSEHVRSTTPTVTNGATLSVA